jgi:hypothetical protein
MFYTAMASAGSMYASDTETLGLDTASCCKPYYRRVRDNCDVFCAMRSVF